MNVITCDDVVPGIEALIYKEVTDRDFNVQIGAEQAGRVPQFPESLKQDEHGQAFLVTDSNNMGHSLANKNCIDVLFYPMLHVDYEAKYGKTIQELNTELVNEIAVKILRPLQDAGQIHAYARGLSLTHDRPAIYVRIFRAEDFPCSEHSEMLLGQPLGQYHCPACSEMQMAGCFHLEREFDDEGNLIDG